MGENGARRSPDDISVRAPSLRIFLWVMRMTPDEIKICTSLGSVTFIPGIGAKRLAKNMADMAARNPGYELTERQRAAVLDIAIKFRRQLPADVVALARRLKGEA